MPAGRPSTYDPEYADQAEKLCRLGATDRDLADFFEVSIRTIERWRAQHEEFCRAVKSGKEEADERVERSLYSRATGYSFESEKIFNNRGEVVRAACVEHVPPDVTAQIFWLKNRQPDKWRDRTQTDINKTTVTIHVAFEEYIRRLNDAAEHRVIDGSVATESPRVEAIPAPVRERGSEG